MMHFYISTPTLSLPVHTQHTHTQLVTVAWTFEAIDDTRCYAISDANFELKWWVACFSPILKAKMTASLLAFMEGFKVEVEKA